MYWREKDYSNKYLFDILGILRGFDQFGTIPTENDSYEILIKNSSKVVIASILWKIAFNADQQCALKVGETFRVNFTEKGKLNFKLFRENFLNLKTWSSTFQD